LLAFARNVAYGLRMPKPRRLNRWALAALVERDPRSKSEIARDARSTPSALNDVLVGRRDASQELVGKLAGALAVDGRAISADPDGVVARLMAVAEVARQLQPQVNGPLSAAIADLDEVLR
jgi:hypothetical protein